MPRYLLASFEYIDDRMPLDQQRQVGLANYGVDIRGPGATDLYA